MAGCSGSGESAQFGNIDRERLLNADSEPENWLTEGRDFGKSHFSTLEQINLETIGELGFAWEYQTGTSRGLEATPIVVDGVLYTSGTTGRAYAIDAATGEEIWAFDPQSDGQFNRWACCDEVNRGVAVWEGMVYVGSFDGRLFGLDAATGDIVWEVDTIIDKGRGYTVSGAPEVAGDVVVIGNAGADYDARGYITAYDLKTGELAWRFFTVPGDPANGFEHPELEMAAETWDPESRWDVGGGGTVWNSMVYDPELNLLYVGTGNAALFNWYERSPSGGDNLFLCSILAIDPDTGRLVWYYQQVPREGWDYTATQPMILADLELDGEVRQVLMQAPKAGFFYILDRATGELLSADKYVPVNWATHVDLETGRPAIDLEQVDYRDGPVFVEPSGMGGHAWNAMAHNAENGLVYIPAIEGGAITYDPTDGHVYRPKQANSGNSTLFGDSMLMDPDLAPPPMRDLLRAVQQSGAARQRAVLKAFDPQTGEVRWEQEAVGFWDRAGVLATSGGLVFQGTDTGYLKAFNAETGEEVVNLEVGTSIIAAPMTYAIDGEQYIAVMAGWGGGGWFAPHDTSAVVKYGNDGRILAFKLGGGDVPLPELVSDTGPMPEPPAQFGTPEQIEEGRQLFARSCSLCHANSDIGLTPDLRRMSADTHAAFNAIVLEGARRTRGMPQWDDVLNEAQSTAIHAYLIDLAWRAYGAQASLPDIEILDTEVYAESVTASADGTVFIGSIKGNVYRAEPGSGEATAWIETSPDNGILTIFGVLADDASNTLWLCSVPNLFGPNRSEGESSLMAFDLATGEQRGVYPFPAPASVCNDITIGPDRTAYASDTSNGRIFALAPGAESLALYGEDETLVGIDGLAFSGDGTLYVNNVRSNQILRIETDGSGAMTGLTELTLSHELGGRTAFA
ncbi:MAG TPA: PQQ-dependent dehydrogenase, methanol/ethanol family [Gammaproteobacteria bacterium]|nr:PQQ-dependent dehydrogenase, methanol/ethanol family [Gammaproteobacteria bacterium]